MLQIHGGSVYQQKVPITISSVCHRALKTNDECSDGKVQGQTKFQSDIIRLFKYANFSGS